LAPPVLGTYLVEVFSMLLALASILAQYGGGGSGGSSSGGGGSSAGYWVVVAIGVAIVVGAIAWAISKARGRSGSPSSR
jgi:hypothetical protein